MSDKRYIFPSLQHKGHAYALHTNSMDLWDAAYRARSPLWLRAGMFQTFGDGLTQHGYETVVPGLHFEDFCGSLAKYLQETEFSAEDREGFASYMFRFDMPSARRIEFALGVKHNPKKTAWYSLQEMKVSSADSKRHDKRWTEVPAWADGSIASVYRLLHNREGMTELLPSFAVYSYIRSYVSDRTEQYGESATEFFKIEGTDVHQAFDALRLTLESFGTLGQARRALACHVSNVTQPAEETKDRAAA